MRRVLYLVSLLVLLSAPSSMAQHKLYENGVKSFKAGNYNEAIASLEDFLSKWQRDKSKDDDIYYMLGVSYFKKDDHPNSMKSFDAALRSAPKSRHLGSISWHLAISCEKLGQIPESVVEYGNAINAYQHDPKSTSKLLTERAKLQHKLEQVPLAKEDLSRALQLDPNNGEAKSTLDKINAATVVVATVPPQTTQKVDPKSKGKNDSKAKGAVDTKPKEEVAKTPTAPLPLPSNEVRKTLTLAEMYAGEKRYALVIGNSNYPQNIGMLPNPKNDATDMAKVLRQQGFQVQLLVDATYLEIRNGIYELKEILEKSKRDSTVALFYYAGHGIQAHNDNWLIPVDSKIVISDEDDIRRMCIPVQSIVLNNLLYSNSRMNIIILDACRNNPFPAVSRSIGGGLQAVTKARGSFIAFATAPGSVASDGTGRNGLYTQELLKALDKPGLTIEQVFKEVRANVLSLSGDKQETWDNSNIVGDFYFNLKNKR